MSADEEQVAFTQRAAVSSLAEADVRFVLERLTRGPEGVLDAVQGGARLVAALVERSESEASAATLLVLGLEGGAADRAQLFARVLDDAIALATAGPLRHLRVPLPPGLTALAPALVARGLTALFVSYTMRTRDAHVPDPPVSAGTFVDWSSSMSAAPVRDLVVRAFAGAPDLIPVSVEDLHARLDAARPRPRLLFEGGELLGVCRTSGPDEAGVGRVPMIAREPARRGDRLGDVLLVEAKRVLAAAGARCFELEVAAANRSALGLYQRHGFEVVSEETTFGRELARASGTAWR
ncbi:MAG: GNAT family N-acetyltransferase [Myxococcales bacterium]|nr:GNAT family N-acetyltransferase [Myxococcales bacterium]